MDEIETEPKMERTKLQKTQKASRGLGFLDRTFTAKLEVIKKLRTLGLTPYNPVLNWDKQDKDDVLARSKDDYFFRIRCRYATVIREEDRSHRVKVVMYTGRRPKEEASQRDTFRKRLATLKSRTDIVALFVPGGGPFKRPRIFWIPADEIDGTKSVISFPALKLRDEYEEFPWEAFYQT